MNAELRDRLLERLLRCNVVCTGRDARISSRRVQQEIFNPFSRKESCLRRIHGTGSWYEGFPDDVSSDIDLMVEYNNLPVVVHKQPDVAPPKGYLVYEINPSNPAFLTLRTVPGVEYHMDIRECIQQSGNHGYLSSSQFVDAAFRGNPDIHEIHGPAGVIIFHPRVGKQEQETTDFVFCLSCSPWPPLTSEFLTRPRQHGWPSQGLIDEIQQDGCHVVPVGHPQSENKDIEWRWSFSLAEKELLHNISDKMYMVMYALKAIKKQNWRQHDSQVTIFSSYFIKTACLWVSEETDQSNISMMDLCRKVIGWLVTCYKKHRIPHYFIPTQNLIGHLDDNSCTIASRWLLDTMYRIEIDEITPLCMNDTWESEYLTLLTQANLIKGLSNISDERILSLSDYVVPIGFRNNREVCDLHPYRGVISIEKAINDMATASSLVIMPEDIYLPIISDLPKLVRIGYENIFRTFLHRNLGDVYQCLFFYLTVIISVLMNENSARIIYRMKHGDQPEYRGFYILCLFVYIYSIIVPSRRFCYNQTIYYYTQGLEMVHPDGWSDRGLGGYVRLAIFYHLIGDRKKLRDTLKTLEPLLEWGMDENVFRSVLHIDINKEESLLNLLPWTRNKDLYSKVIEPSEYKSVSINPVVLGYYLLIKWLQDDTSQKVQPPETRQKIEKCVSCMETIIKEKVLHTVEQRDSAEQILQIVKSTLY